MKTNQKGFSVVEVLLVLVAVCLIGGAGWYVWQSQHKNNSTTSTATALPSTASPQPTQTTPVAQETPKTTTAGILVTTADKKVQLTLPTTWHVVVSSSNPTGEQVISVNKDTQLCDKYKPSDCSHVAPCLDTEDTVACMYVAELQPKSLDRQKDSVWTLTVEKTDWSIAKATQSLLGELNTKNTVEKNSDKVNGYDAAYVKVKSGDCSAECYVDVHYFVKDNGYLLHFYNREQYTNHSANSAAQDYSAYTPDFATVVRSLKLGL